MQTMARKVQVKSGGNDEEGDIVFFYWTLGYVRNLRFVGLGTQSVRFPELKLGNACALFHDFELFEKASD